MPCMGTSSSNALELEQSSVVQRVDGRKPTARDGNRFYSAVVDETEEWAQVMINWHLLLYCLYYNCNNYAHIIRVCHYTIGVTKNSELQILI